MQYTPGKTLMRVVGLAIAPVVGALALVAPDPGLAQQIDLDHPNFRDIVREPSAGDQHIDGRYDYGTDFPTSGPHSATPTQRGFYDEPLRREGLVHALEHGNIVIYYDTPSDTAMQFLRRWTDAYRGALDAVIAVRHPGLGERLVLTAWQHRLELDAFDERAAFFVDAFRGRGPEAPVR